MSVCICILNYNSWEDTNECLGSLVKQISDDCQLVVVDNASTNNSVEMIEKECQKLEVDYLTASVEQKAYQKSTVYILKSDRNGGFSSGNNLGLKFIKKCLSVDTVLFLNNDTVVPADFVQKMESSYLYYKDKYNTKIALSCFEYNYYTKEISHKGFHYLQLLSGLAFRYPIFPFFKYICGACLMVDIDAPFMDEEYFLYFDDVRYTKILKEKGYQIYSTDSTKYFHKISKTTNCLGNTKIKYQFDSTWRFYKKYYPRLMSFVYFVRCFQYFFTDKKMIRKIMNTTYQRYK